MWQAISRLLSEQLGEGEIELRNELPGGEVHAAWHLRYAGRDFFVKCDERELLPGFTAEADQLELLSRSKTVTVPKVWAVGADRDYSFLVMDYLPPRPLDAHSAFILGQQIARLHQWSDQPQFGLDFDNALSTTPQPNTWQRRWSTFFAEQRIGWQLELAAEKGIAFGNIDAIVEHIQQRLASHQPQPSLLHGDLWSGNCALGPDGPYIFDPAPRSQTAWPAGRARPPPARRHRPAQSRARQTRGAPRPPHCRSGWPAPACRGRGPRREQGQSFHSRGLRQ